MLKRSNALSLYSSTSSKVKKIDMQTTFGYYRKLATGGKGKILIMPDTTIMHCYDRFVPDWVEYSCFDAEILWYLRETLS